jgi:phage gp29-like protein
MIDSSGVVKDNVAILGAALQSAVQNATLALPEGWTAEFMSAAQTGASFQDFETACVKRIQRLILGQTLTSDTGADGGGSYALGQVHNEVRIDRRNADIRLVSQAIQTLIDNLWSLNGFTGTPPDFIMEDGQGLELPRAERDAKLVQAGIIKLTPEYLLRVYDFEDGDFLIPEAQPTQILRQDSQQQEDPEEPEDDSEDDEPMNATNLSLLKFAPTKSFPDQESLDTGIDALIAARNNHAIAADMVQPVIDLVMRSKDYREVLAGLAETFPDMDSDRLEERMARAMFAADIWGMVNSQKD